MREPRDDDDEQKGFEHCEDVADIMFLTSGEFFWVKSDHIKTVDGHEHAYKHKDYKNDANVPNE